MRPQGLNGKKFKNSRSAPRGTEKPWGLAGVLRRSQGNVLIIAGRHHYPQGFPWQAPQRAVYSANLCPGAHIHPQNEGPGYTWVDPCSSSAGGFLWRHVSLPIGVLSYRRSTGLGIVDDSCFSSLWDKSARKITSTPFPKLPKPPACHTAVLVDRPFTRSAERLNQREMRHPQLLRPGPRQAHRPHRVRIESTPRMGDVPARIFPVAAASLEGTTQSLHPAAGTPPSECSAPPSSTSTNSICKRRKNLLTVVDRQLAIPAMSWLPPLSTVPPHDFVVVGGMDEDITRLMERNGRDLGKGKLDDTDRCHAPPIRVSTLSRLPPAVLGYDAEIGEWNHIGISPAVSP